MWQRWNTDNISSRKLHQGAADHQPRRAGLHDEDVSLSFVPLDLAVGLSVNQQNAVYLAPARQDK